MKARKIISLFMAIGLCFSAVACDTPPVVEDNSQRVLTEEEITKIADKIPDYSSKNHQFTMFGYSSVSDGTWTEGDDVFYLGENMISKERIQEYKDAGMTILHPQSYCNLNVNTADNFDFESSTLKQIMDWSEEVGLDGVIVSDYRITGMCANIGEGLTYETEEQIDEQLRIWMAPYMNHPAFYGVQLPDEPNSSVMPAYGILYKAVKRICPDAYILHNFFPPVGGAETKMFPAVTEEEIAVYEGNGGLKNRMAAFDKYFAQFLDYSGADYIMYDQYPLDNTGVHPAYLAGLQTAAKVAKRYGVEFHFVSQTSTLVGGGNKRVMSEADLRWLNNTQLGFGVDEISYFTYHARSTTKVETWLDDATFINHFGEKTEIYYIMQKIIAENQKFAPVIRSFDWNACMVATAETTLFNNEYALYVDNQPLTKISKVEVNKEAVLVSELLDSENNRYMYMIQNVIDPQYKASTTWQTTTVQFNESYAYAAVYKNGERQIVKLKDNAYTVTQHPGEAVYVIPFNA